MNSIELQDRLKKFAYRIVALCETLPRNRTVLIIENQLLRSAFSAAANYRAACKAQTHKGFTAKFSISFEEMDESLFWLEGILDLKLVEGEELKLAIKEADELTRILASSRKTSQNKTKANIQYTI